MKKTLLLALALQTPALALAVSSPEPVNPDHRWFQADVIVFRHLETTSDEAWPQITQHSFPANSIELKAPAASVQEPLAGDLLAPVQAQTPVTPNLVRDSYIRLPSGEFELGKQAASLSRSSRYQVLSQTAWRMPVDESLHDIPVKVRASGDQNGHYLLEGTITVSASRFLHVDADLWYSELASEALSSKLTLANEAEGSENSIGDLSQSGLREGLLMHSESLDSPVRITRNFHLNQRRRIRNTSEVQYLDTPVIGVLVKLTPYDRPQTILEMKESEVKESETTQL